MTKRKNETKDEKRESEFLPLESALFDALEESPYLEAIAFGVSKIAKRDRTRVALELLVTLEDLTRDVDDE